VTARPIGWEAKGTPQALKRCGRWTMSDERDGCFMKNTGKRIFFAVVAFAVANLGVLVMAGAVTSQR
jgi:predicted regulator of Ras-like GTPase activity (Roadblock/LC7/MglB family)